MSTGSAWLQSSIIMLAATCGLSWFPTSSDYLPWPPAPGPEPGSAVFSRVGQPEPVFAGDYYPFLDDEPEGVSVSLGTVTEGRLVNAVELPVPGPTWNVLPVQYQRNLRYGTQDLIALLIDAAADVSDSYPGSVLWLGNLGRRSGGDIPYSVSHNSGRDADLAFYFVDEAGEPMTPPDLLEVDRQLQAVHGDVTYHFDVGRNWALVESLLSHPEVQVQFLFIANHLKRALVRYAQEHDVASEIVSRARVTMGQPGPSNPHDDHLHVRIYCGRGDVGRGCINSGRIHSWVDTYDGELAARLAQVRDALSHPDEEQRARAVQRLVILDSRTDLSEIAELLDDPEAIVRAAAARALGELGGGRWVDSISTAIRSEEDASALYELVGALARISGESARAQLVALLEVPHRLALNGRELDLRATVVDALGHIGEADVVPALLELMQAGDPYLRARTQWALERLTYVNLGSDWADRLLDFATHNRGCRAWSEWFDAFGRSTASTWLREGLRRLGFEADDGDLDLSAWAELAGSGPQYLSYRAQQTLMQRTARVVPSLTWPLSDAGTYWQNRVR